MENIDLMQIWADFLKGVSPADGFNGNPNVGISNFSPSNKGVHTARNSLTSLQRFGQPTDNDLPILPVEAFSIAGVPSDNRFNIASDGVRGHPRIPLSTRPDMPDVRSRGNSSSFLDSLKRFRSTNNFGDSLDPRSGRV